MSASDREAAQRKRERAIKQLRELGVSDDEIAQELGVDSIAKEQEPEVLDVEIVYETPNLPALVSTPGPNRPVDDENAKHPYQTRPGRDERNTSTNAENVAAYNASLEKDPERRCRAMNAKGEPCRRYAIPGGFTCKTHGGSARQVVSKARIRVENASNRLMGKLIEFAFDDTKPAGVQLDAIKDSLNRAGLKPPDQVEIGPIKPYEEVFDGIYSGPRSSSHSESHADSSDYPPATAMPADDPEQASEFTRDADSDRLRERERDEPRERRQSHRPSGQNGAEGLTGYDAMRVANELRALPPGRT